MSRLTNQQWVDLVRNTIKIYNDGKTRLGQSYMIALCEMIVSREIDKNLYDEITGTENDPFYDDLKLINFIKYLS